VLCGATFYYDIASIFGVVTSCRLKVVANVSDIYIVSVFTLKMEAIYSIETMTTTYDDTTSQLRRSLHHHEKLRSQILFHFLFGREVNSAEAQMTGF
jgi:hypothetical protein